MSVVLSDSERKIFFKNKIGTNTLKILIFSMIDSKLVELTLKKKAMATQYSQHAQSTESLQIHRIGSPPVVHQTAEQSAARPQA